MCERLGHVQTLICRTGTVRFSNASPDPASPPSGFSLDVAEFHTAGTNRSYGKQMSHPGGSGASCASCPSATRAWPPWCVSHMLGNMKGRTAAMDKPKGAREPRASRPTPASRIARSSRAIAHQHKLRITSTLYKSTHDVEIAPRYPLTPRSPEGSRCLRGTLRSMDFAGPPQPHSTRQKTTKRSLSCRYRYCLLSPRWDPWQTPRYSPPSRKRRCLCHGEVHPRRCSHCRRCFGSR